jgi:phosphoglycerol transferase MdoB-like AlkP superfamily enzyme
MKDVFDWGENEKGYINSAYYTDKCLGNYFKEAEKQHWYKNTLFIIVADHSHNSPRNWHIFSPKYRKIPLLLYGEVIKEEYRGVKWSKLGSQVDLAATVLSQLNMDYSAFKWSKNLFHSGVAEYAYYEVGDGLGWVTPHNRFVYHKGLNNYYEEKYENEEKKQETLKQGKSYLQVLFQEYLDF